MSRLVYATLPGSCRPRVGGEAIPGRGRGAPIVDLLALLAVPILVWEG